MKILSTIKEMAEKSLAVIRSEKKHGFVPTMGALHAGHISLIERARQDCEVVTVSIFVNPVQFNEQADFDLYPRTFEDDCRLAEEAGADFVFAPQVEEMYPKNRDTVVMVDRLSDHLCGLARGRQHFVGVCTVVAKLFNIVRPDMAYFGQKDAQQALILQRMAVDLNFPVQLKICPIVREKDGLAMSSRNARLPEGKREEALALWRALSLGRDMIEGGEHDARVVMNAMAELVLENEGIDLDYLDIVDTETLDDVETIDDLVMIAGAIRLADIRLIDNILVAPRREAGV